MVLLFPRKNKHVVLILEIYKLLCINSIRMGRAIYPTTIRLLLFSRKNEHKNLKTSDFGLPSELHQHGPYGITIARVSHDEAKLRRDPDLHQMRHVWWDPDFSFN